MVLSQAVEWNNWNSDGSADYAMYNGAGLSRVDGSGYVPLTNFNGRDGVVLVPADQGIRFMLEGPLTTPESAGIGIRIQITHTGEPPTGFHFLSGFLETGQFDVSGDYGLTTPSAAASRTHADGWTTTLYEIELSGGIIDLALYPIYDSNDIAYIDQVYVETYFTTPIPGSSWLLGSGIIGLFGFIRKQDYQL